MDHGEAACEDNGDKPHPCLKSREQHGPWYLSSDCHSSLSLLSLSFFQFLTLVGEGFNFLSKVQKEKMVLSCHLVGKTVIQWSRQCCIGTGYRNGLLAIGVTISVTAGSL